MRSQDPYAVFVLDVVSSSMHFRRQHHIAAEMGRVHGELRLIVVLALASILYGPVAGAFFPASSKAPLQRAGPSPFDGSTPLVPHHTALKTRNITMAIQFYSLLGFELEAKFRAGPARAAWMSQQRAPPSSSRLELIEVPSNLLKEPEGMRRRARNLIEQQELLGWNHLALDVTQDIQAKGYSQLSEWMNHLNANSVATFNKSLRVALEPRQQIIGGSVYELGFIFDADGALIEFLHKQSEIEQQMDSGWGGWDGKGFV